MRTCLITLCLLLTGCATGTGTKWYAPATWFSHRPADAVDTARKDKTNAEQEAIKAAQRYSHQTAEALASAPDSRPVAVAKKSNNASLRLLDQVAGPLTTKEETQIADLVAGLLSENAEIRAKAERESEKQTKKLNEVSGELSSAQAAVAKAEGKLREAFERENALANELRSQRALFWIACGVAVLVAAGWLYAKVVYGGLPMAAGMFMRDFRQKHPDMAKNAEDIFDRYLSRREQSLVARYADK